MKISGDDARVALPLFQVEYGGSIPTSPLQLHIEEINVHLACKLNAAWHSRLPEIHWSNVVRNRHYVCFGAIHANICYAVAIWSSPIARSISDNALELRRMAIAPDAPKNTASRMLAVMRRLIQKKFDDVVSLVSYQDTEVHSGTIYKAAGWEPAHKTQGDDWVRNNRQRSRSQTAAVKIRWEIGTQNKALQATSARRQYKLCSCGQKRLNATLAVHRRSKMITPKELLAIGFEEFSWNGGMIMEYWKSYKPGKDYEWEYRLGVRYGEHKNEPCNVWLFTGSGMLKMIHVTTLEQVITLYELLTGVRLTTA